MPFSRQIWTTALAWLVLHALVCAAVFYFEPTRHPEPGVKFFAYWDASHYTSIAIDGYGGSLWAFYPLYPLLVKALAPITGFQNRPDIGGAVYSTLMFGAFCGLQAWLARRRDERLSALTPRSLGGWLLFLFTPASYIFHTHHTESLFLLLSFAALATSHCGRWKTAALLAGLCALTRNQGVFVAVAVALEGALRSRGKWERAKVFCLSGAISGLLFSCYPLYQHFQAGDALAFVRVQATNWRVVSSFSEAIGTLWFANPWQEASLRECLHLSVFVIQLTTAVYLAFRREFSLALYIACSTIIVLPQGHLLSMFRFGSVLFPVWFVLGDRLIQMPRRIGWALLAVAIGYHFAYTRIYALGDWAY